MKKFDFCIGNPPYNVEAQKTSTSDDPIYHIFMDAAYSVADKIELITPARFLSNAGKTPATWNKKMLADEHLKVLFYENDSQKVFSNTSIPGGVCVTYRDSEKLFGAIQQFVPFTQLQTIDKKVRAFSERTLDSIIYSQNKFNLDSVYKAFPQLKKRMSGEGKDKRFRQIVFERFPELFKVMPNGDCVRTLGKIGNDRVYRFINRSYVVEEPWIDKYKVFVPFSNGASGTLSENEAARLISKPVLGMPGDGITQTFIGVGAFETELEANALYKYILSKFTRALLGILKVTQGNKAETWGHVPIQDFTSNSDIDWSKSIPEIDQQLYEKYGLSDDEISFIETHVKEME